MNKENLTWVAFYSEFAEKLLPYIKDRKTLIGKTKAVCEQNTFSNPTNALHTYYPCQTWHGYHHPIWKNRNKIRRHFSPDTILS